MKDNKFVLDEIDEDIEDCDDFIFNEDTVNKLLKSE